MSGYLPEGVTQAMIDYEMGERYDEYDRYAAECRADGFAPLCYEEWIIDPDGRDHDD
jgi:hypothetical protein